MADYIELEVQTPSEIEMGFGEIKIVLEPSLQTKSVTITQNGQSQVQADAGYDGLDKVNIDTNVPNPSTGNINITSTSQVDVSQYATAQVVDADLVAGNIKKDVNVLGVVGTLEGFEYTSCVSSIDYMFYGRSNPAVENLPETLDMTAFNKISSAHDAFGIYSMHPLYKKPSCKNVIFKFEESVPCANMFDGNGIIERVTFIDGISLINNSYNMFSGAYNLSAIYGKIKSVANLFTGGFDGCTSLEHVEFAENIISGTASFSSSSLLTDASIISISNGLNESSTGKTLSFHATPKARLSTIMGTVALDETETFHIFTADASGTTTLQDFITNTKGWTIA